MAMQLTDKRMLFLCSHTTTTLPYYVWKNITHHTTIRSGRLPDSAHHCSGKQEWQHRHKELRSIQFTTARTTERARRTLFAQVRTLKAQTRQNYNRDMSTKFSLLPWIDRRSAYIMNRYAVHSNGCTSYFNRWNREHHFGSFLRQGSACFQQ